MTEPVARQQPPVDADPLRRLLKIMHILRAPRGCPWDAEQTHQSLLPHLLEEAYETAAAIRSDRTEDMMEELGDLLLQVIIHAEIASETQRFDFDQIATVVGDKLIRRHPHVFATSHASDSDAVLRQWDKIKRAEKGQEAAPYLEGVGDGLPALMRATKLQKKAAKVGFDWPDTEGVFAKIREEIDELEQAMQAGAPDAISEELGDLLFALVNLARHRGLDAENVLSAANDKFRRRFDSVERKLLAEESSLEEAALEEMESAWQSAKSET